MNEATELLRAAGALTLIVGALIAVRKTLAGRGRRGADMRVVSRVGVAKGSSLIVVEVAGKRLLLGSAERGVQLITELPPEDQTEEPAQETAGAFALPAATGGPGTGLIDVLRRLTVRRERARPSREAHI